MAEAMKSIATPPTPRKAEPAVMSTMQASSARSIPTRRPNHGASIANRPRQITGNVVKALAPVSESPVEATISGNTTERLEKRGAG